MLEVVLGVILLCSNDGRCHTEAMMFPNELTCLSAGSELANSMHERNKKLHPSKQWTLLESKCTPYSLKTGEEL